MTDTPQYLTPDELQKRFSAARIKERAEAKAEEERRHEAAVKAALERLGTRRVVEIAQVYAAERHAGACNADSRRLWRTVWTRLCKVLDAMR